MQVPFTNGNVTIVLQSVKVDDAVKMKLQMTSLDSSNDWLSLLPKGEPFTPRSMSSLWMLLQSCRKPGA